MPRKNTTNHQTKKYLDLIQITRGERVKKTKAIEEPDSGHSGIKVCYVRTEVALGPASPYNVRKSKKEKTEENQDSSDDEFEYNISDKDGLKHEKGDPLRGRSLSRHPR